MSPLAIFAAMFSVDLCWVFYVKKVQHDSPFKASCWAVFLFLTSSIVVIGFTSDPWLLIPASVGAFAGTWVGVLLNKEAA